MLTFESVFAERWKICDIRTLKAGPTANRMPAFDKAETDDRAEQTPGE
jgi:hypothetical protein